MQSKNPNPTSPSFLAGLPQAEHTRTILSQQSLTTQPTVPLRRKENLQCKVRPMMISIIPLP